MITFNNSWHNENSQSLSNPFMQSLSGSCQSRIIDCTPDITKELEPVLII